MPLMNPGNNWYEEEEVDETQRPTKDTFIINAGVMDGVSITQDVVIAFRGTLYSCNFECQVYYDSKETRFFYCRFLKKPIYIGA